LTFAPSAKLSTSRLPVIIPRWLQPVLNCKRAHRAETSFVIAKSDLQRVALRRFHSPCRLATTAKILE